MILIYTTHPTKEHAEKIIKELLKEKLIVCANTFPIESSYKWEGAIKKEKEAAALLKTQEKHWEAIKNKIKELHDYATPCIIKIQGEANEQFTTWMNKETP